MEISLRAVEPTDIDFLYRMENTPQVWNVSWGDAPVSRQMLWEYINAYTADIYADRQLRLIVTADGTPVGTVDISDFDPRNSRAMLGVAIEDEHRRKGIATKAVSLTIDYCRNTLALHQLAVMVPKYNDTSLALFTKLGFRTAGCLRSWLRHGRGFSDVVLMQRMLQ